MTPRRHLLVTLICVLLTTLGAPAVSTLTDDGADAPLRIVALGDSTTAWRGTIERAYPERLGDLLEARGVPNLVFNAGEPGDTTEDARRRLNHAVLVHQPDVVIIQLGLNDSAIDVHKGRTEPRVSAEEYEANLDAMIEALAGRDIRVILMTQNPLVWTDTLRRIYGRPPYDPDDRWGMNVLNAEYAQIVRRLAARHDVQLIDVYRMYLDYDAVSGQSADRLLPDGMNPTDAGHAMVAERLADRIGKMLEVGRLEHRRFARPNLPIDEPMLLVDAGEPRGVFFPQRPWRQSGDALVGGGPSALLVADQAITGGDFIVRARLRIEDQARSAASFFFDDNHFGFEGAEQKIFVSGPVFGGLDLLDQSTDVFDRGAWIDFEMIRAGGEIRFLIDDRVVFTHPCDDRGFDRFGFRPMRSTMHLREFSILGSTTAIRRPSFEYANLPWIDLTMRPDLLETIATLAPGVVAPPALAASEDGQSLHLITRGGSGSKPTLEHRTSSDRGRSWSEPTRLPEDLAVRNGRFSLHTLMTPDGAERLILFVMTPVPKRAYSDDGGTTWASLEPIVSGAAPDVLAVAGAGPPASLIALGDGRHLAMYDVQLRRGDSVASRLVQVVTADGGRSWQVMPVAVRHPEHPAFDPIGPALIRSAHGDQLICLVSDAQRRTNTMLMTSDDSGRSWSPLRELPAALTGDGHVMLRAPDDRLVVAFFDTKEGSDTFGEFIAWVGSFDDLHEGREGRYRVRLAKHAGSIEDPVGIDIERMADGTYLCAMTRVPKDGANPVISTVRLALDELDELEPKPGYSIPLIDLSNQTHRQVVVDREPGLYLGHPTTVLLEDGRTMIAVYPKGHGRGAIVMKRSDDGGRTWSERLPTPDNWATSKEVPTIHRVIDPDSGERRLILFSGFYPIRMAHSEDDGRTWTPLEPIGDFGGIVAMASVEQLADGDVMALFHDDGRFITQSGIGEIRFKVYKTLSSDGGLTWSPPVVIATHRRVQLCEPGLIRSPDGKQIAVLMRENSRARNSFVIFSDDEGETWSPPRELPGALTGDRHTAKYAPDGRLFISFRDMTREGPTRGDWVGWVGTYEDILYGREGQYRIRLMDNHHAWDCAYPGVEVLTDGTIVATTYGHWIEGESPFIVSVRFTLAELDELASRAGK